VILAPEPGRAADTAGAVRRLGAIHPANALRPAGNLTFPNLHTLPATRISGAPVVGRTHIAWQLPLLAVLHPSDACQRRS